jgi:tetratricopeptide (TPR) repeat protein
MKRFYLTAIFLVVSCLGVFADDFNKANAFYANGKYSEALVTYKKIVDSGKESAALYFNMGNAYFKSDSLAHSIYYYEKALKLDPSDEDIHRNLDLARGRITDKIEPLPQMVFTSWWNHYLTLWNANTWSMLSIAAFFASALLFFFFLRAFLPSRRRLFFWSGTCMLLLAGWITFSAARAGDYFYNPANAKAVVFGQSVNVSSTPSQDGTVLFVIHEGTTVRIQDESAGWYRIRLENGNSGWILAREIRII